MAAQPAKTDAVVFKAQRDNAMLAVPVYAPQLATATAFYTVNNTHVMLAAVMSDASKTMAAEARGLIFGVTPEAVLVEAYAFLADARVSGHIEALIRCAILGVGLGFTVSREWVAEYAGTATPHMYSTFEMNGRSAKTQKDGIFLDQWVVGSPMNAHAVRIFGHMLVHWAPRGSLLAAIKEKCGTIFEPPRDTDMSERAVLMRAAAAELTAEEINMVRTAGQDFESLVAIVNEIFGQPGASVQQMADWAAHYQGMAL